MKIIKGLETGLLLNRFGTQKQYFLSVSALVFFGFDRPDFPLSEQDFWTFWANELGSEIIPDMGLPKPRGEVLVWGKCFAPPHRPQTALSAGFRLGPVDRKVLVFGRRTWKKALGWLNVISDPEPFQEMPITYQRAFGGPGFALNQIGCGLGPVRTSQGGEDWPLPNIEDPKRLVGSTDDRPDPAGFGPLDPSWPQRASKTGTYDRRWLGENWPDYPDDLDWSYFNAAPLDQQIDGYFRGGEPASFFNLHPNRPVLKTRLPRLRQRLFLQSLADFGKPEAHEVFREIKTSLDTVWLFPHAERGLAIFRGLARILDDEADDVTHLYLTPELLDDTPRSLQEHYQDFLRKDRDGPLDLPEMEESGRSLAEAEKQMDEAKKRLDEAQARLEDLPLQVSDALTRGLGQAPTPMRTFSEIVNQALASMDAHDQGLLEGEQSLKNLSSTFGHLVKINTGSFGQAKMKLDLARTEIRSLAREVAKIGAVPKPTKPSPGKRLREVLAGLDPEFLQKTRLNPEDFSLDIETPEENLWHQRGMRLVESCRDRLAADPQMLNHFKELGLRPYTLKRHWIGLNPSTRQFKAALWGLKRQDDQDPCLSVEAGLVVPHFNGAILDRISVRPGPAEVFGSDRIVEGSEEDALLLGVEPGKPFVRTADELEAVLLHQDLGCLCGVVCLKDPAAAVDKKRAELLKQAPQALIVQYPAEAEDPAFDLQAWRNCFPQAQLLKIPLGENLFETRGQGLDLKEWVIQALEPAMGREWVEEAAGERDLFSLIDPVQLYEKMAAGIKKSVSGQLDRVAGLEAGSQAKIREALSAFGLDQESILKPAAGGLSGNPFEKIKNEIPSRIARAQASLDRTGQLRPELIPKFKEMEETFVGLLEQASQGYARGRAELDRAGPLLQGQPPLWAQKMKAEMQLPEPDDLPDSGLTRDKVLDLYAQGKSLSGAKLFALDLSGLDLCGIDLRQAIIQDTSFAGTLLKEANFAGCFIQKANFSRADLKEADLSEARILQTDLTGVDLSRADLAGMSLEESSLTQAVLHNARMMNVVVQKTDLSRADLAGVDVTKGFFLESNLDQCRFASGRACSTVFWSTRGARLNFEGADLENARFGGQAHHPETNFRQIKASRACWMDSDFSGSDLAGAVLDQGLIERCNLSGANLQSVSARKTRFNHSDFRGADLRLINLFGGSLRKARLADADLSGANLYGVEFFKTLMLKTKLDRANLRMTHLEGRKDLNP